MTGRLAVEVEYENQNDSWAVDYNHTYDLVSRGIKEKDKAESVAEFEAQSRANGRGKPVDLKIYERSGEHQETITKKPEL